MAIVESTPEIDYRVKLREQGGSQSVVFKATPDLIETRNVNYKTIDPVHAPGQIYAYVNSSSRSFNISSIKIISRTQQEASINLNMLWKLRSWTMPQFGTSTLGSKQRQNRDDYNNVANSFQANRTLTEQEKREYLSLTQDNYETNYGGFGVELRGQPPKVLLLSAYSLDSSTNPNTTGSRQPRAEHIKRVPVVILNMSIPFPSDVDYIPTESGVPMPTIMSMDMTLAETHSPREYERFSLRDFKNGVLTGF